MNPSPLESKLNQACDELMQSKSPSKILEHFYNALTLLWMKQKELEDRLQTFERAIPVEDNPVCRESEPEILLVVPQEILNAAKLIEDWTRSNGHRRWKLLGIQSRED